MEVVEVVEHLAGIRLRWKLLRWWSTWWGSGCDGTCGGGGAPGGGQVAMEVVEVVERKGGVTEGQRGLLIGCRIVRP
eukprot:360885-Chlamydomonas_euryale.AAC.4